MILFWLILQTQIWLAILVILRQLKRHEALDECLGRLMEAANSTDSIILLTSDHGNAELMYDDELNMTHTRHT